MYFSSSYSLDEIAFKYKVQKDILSHHIRYLKQVKQFKDRQYMKENKSRSRKRTQKVIKEVEDLILSKRYSQFTISSIQKEFNSQTENSHRISISSCRRILKEDLKYSYKRCSTVSLKTLPPENIRRYHESVALLSKMKQEDVEVIFFDGFSLDTKKWRFYHWSPRGEPSFLSQIENEFHMSFVIGISSIRVYGIMGVVGSTDSNIIEHFISEMLYQRNKNQSAKRKPFILCMDNASVHISKATQKFLLKSKIRATTIAARYPSLNPIEKLIA